MESDQAQLKSAVYLTVVRLIEDELSALEKDGVPPSPSPTFTAALVELVYNQIISLGEDLELFANHAGRSTIRPADLYMVTRKNDILTQALKEYEQRE